MTKKSSKMHYRYQGKKQSVSTDMSLSEEEIIQLYGKRWGIEVFFKVCKSYLRLARDCRSISYDAMTAHVAVVFTRYAMLAVERRENIDERSFGDLFFFANEELRDLPYHEALYRVLSEFADFIQQYYQLDENIVNDLVDIFWEPLPGAWTKDLRECA